MDVKLLRNISNRLWAFFVIVVCLTITGCHFNSTYNNREADKEEGEKVVTQFYELLKSKNYQETYKLFNKKFFDVTDTQKLNYMYDISFEKLGNIERFHIERWETQAIIGTDPQTDYLFLCEVKRTNFVSKETITLTKENDVIKIVGYLVNSDGFFQKEKN